MSKRARQREQHKRNLLKVIKTFIIKNGYPPSARAIAPLFDLRIRQTEHYFRVLFEDGDLVRTNTTAYTCPSLRVSVEPHRDDPLLNYLCDYILENGYPPLITELTNEFPVYRHTSKSLKSIFAEHIERGEVVIHSGHARAIQVTAVKFTNYSPSHYWRAMIKRHGTDRFTRAMWSAGDFVQVCVKEMKAYYHGNVFPGAVEELADLTETGWLAA